MSRDSFSRFTSLDRIPHSCQVSLEGDPQAQHDRARAAGLEYRGASGWSGLRLAEGGWIVGIAGRYRVFGGVEKVEELGPERRVIPLLDGPVLHHREVPFREGMVAEEVAGHRAKSPLRWRDDRRADRKSVV